MTVRRPFEHSDRCQLPRKWETLVHGNIANLFISVLLVCWRMVLDFRMFIDQIVFDSSLRVNNQDILHDILQDILQDILRYTKIYPKIYTLNHQINTWQMRNHVKCSWIANYFLPCISIILGNNVNQNQLKYIFYYVI